MEERDAKPVVIAGQGLAGTLLAWELVKAGRKVLIMDEDRPVTSSKIAAGIVTPITGKRLALNPETPEHLREALETYAWIARLLGKEHYHPMVQVRLWQDGVEPVRFETKRRLPGFAAHLAPQRAAPLVDPALFCGSGEGFEMTTSGWLDSRNWLAESAAWFEARGMLQRIRLDPNEVQPAPDEVRLPGGIRASMIVFCEGAAARTNPWFPWVQWKCAKGEILTLKIPALAPEKRIINRGGWLLPIDGSGTFRTGSTYTWDDLTTETTAEARTIMENRLHHLLRPAWQVTAHEAAVRPIIHQSLARIGRHPVYPNLVFFNGLGSKGVLNGPHYARLLAKHLLHGASLPMGVDVAGN